MLEALLSPPLLFLTFSPFLFLLDMPATVFRSKGMSMAFVLFSFVLLATLINLDYNKNIRENTLKDEFCTRGTPIQDV